MLQYLPAGIGRHNLRKHSVLRLLEFRASGDGSSWLDSGQIGSILRLSPGECDSLYVGLSKWASWHLIARRLKNRQDVGGEPSSRYRYALAKRGVEWLRFLPRVEARAGIPPGRLSKLISELCGLVIWWEVRGGYLLYIKAPFSSVDDLQEIGSTPDSIPVLGGLGRGSVFPPERLGGPPRIFGCHSLIKSPDAKAALNKVGKLNLTLHPDLLKAVLDSPVSGLSRVTDARAVRLHRQG